MESGEVVKIPVPQGVTAADIVADLIDDESKLRVAMPGQETQYVKLAKQSVNLRAKYSKKKRVLTIRVTSKDSKGTTADANYSSLQSSFKDKPKSKSTNKQEDPQVQPTPAKKDCLPTAAPPTCLRPARGSIYISKPVQLPEVYYDAAGLGIQTSIEVYDHPYKGRILIAKKPFKPGEVIIMHASVMRFHACC